MKLTRSEYNKLRREERKEKGLCTRCGVPLTDKTYLTCKRCRDKWRLEYYPASTRASTRRSQQDRGKDHDCWQCGKKLPVGYFKKKCPECIEKSRQGYFRNHKAEEEQKKSRLKELGKEVLDYDLSIQEKEN